MVTAAVGPGWRRALPALVMLWMVIAFVYRDAGLAMVALWNRSETYAHAWVVPPISLWLIWRMRTQVLALDPRPAFWVLLPLAAVGLVWLLGELVAVNTATQFALVAMLVLAVPALLGIEVAKALVFPLGFLFFAVPAGEFMTPTLMQWTAEVTIGALRLSGIPVYREGLQFVIPSGHWSVVEACSGIRYLISSIMVGTLFAYLNYQSTRRRLVFVGISIIVPLVANWLRAYMIVMLGHYSNNQIAAGADHLVYGWVLFGIVIVLLYWIGARWAESMPDAPVLPAAKAAWPVASGWGMVVLSIGVVWIPLAIWQRIDALERDATVQLKMPAVMPGWQSADEPAPAWTPGFANPSARVKVGYAAPGGAKVGVYVGYYRQQGGERKLVSSINVLVSSADQGWNVVAGGARTVPLDTGVLAVREGQLLQTETPGRQRRQRIRVWQFYWVDGHLEASNVQAKLSGAWGRLKGRGDDSAAILLFADDEDPARAEASLIQFASTGLSAIVASLEATRRAAQEP